MAVKWLIDTDILIDYLRGVTQAVKFLEKITENTVCYLLSITIAELYAGIKEGNERKQLEFFLQAFEPVAIDPAIARNGGLYRRDYGKSHGVGLADALIAATADSCGATLATLNKKHSPMLKNVSAPYIKPYH